MLLFGWIERVLHLPGGMYPLFLRTWRFYDFTEFQDKFTYFHQATFFQIPGFLLLLSSPRGHCFRWIYAVRILCAQCVSRFLLSHFYRRRLCSWTRNVPSWYGDSAGDFFLFGSSMLLSYPFWFLVDRANIEMVNWVVSGAGSGLLLEQEMVSCSRVLWRCDFLKMFPFVFLGLLLSARKYWAIAWSIVICVLTTCASTWFIGPTYRIASEGIAKGMEIF